VAHVHVVPGSEETPFHMTLNILAKRHLPALTDFAASNVLLGFDYDGTLAPIAPTPAAARMRPKTSHLLARVARRYPCVVISGRPLDDLTRRLRGIPVWHLVGDHGFERSGHPGRQAPHVRGWVNTLRGRLRAHQGLFIEPKKHSVTIHYRHVRDKRRALEAIADAVGHLQGARARGGVEAVTVLPCGGPHKGVALQQLRRVCACHTAIYVGDDDTDEDAFASAGSERLLSIRVGTLGASLARYRIRAQTDIDRFLLALLELRATAPRAGRR
jgi:trehalose 6-phosphate phosphatase